MATLAIPAAAPKDRLRGLFCTFLAVAMALSAFVPVDPAPVDFALLATVPLAFLLLRKRLLLDPRFQLVFILLGLYLVANGLASLEAQDVGQALFFVAVSAYLMVAFLALSVVFDQHGAAVVRAAFNGYLASALVSCVLGVLAFFGVGVVPWDLLMYGRIVAFFKDPNVFAPYLVPMCIYALDRYRAEPGGRRKAGWLAAVCALNTTVLLCFSRAAWGNDLLALAVYLALRPPRLKSLVRPRTLIAFGAIVLFVAATAVVLLSSAAVNTVLVERLAPQAYDEDRFGTQRLAFETLLGSPLGIGPGQSELRFAYATHSLYVRLLVETGWAGALTIVALLGVTVVRAVRLARRGPVEGRSLYAIAAASLCGLVLNSFVVDTLHWRHFWLLLAVAWGRYGAQGQRFLETRSCAPEAPSLAMTPLTAPRQSLSATVV